MPTLRILLVALALPLVAAGSALAQDAGPRETVAAIATEIRNLYFSVERGDAIADALEAEARAGRYDALTDPRDLAATLSNRLRPEDAHFSVVWAPASSGPSPGPAHASDADGRAPGSVQAPRSTVDLQRLGNYGFRRVEVLPGNVGLIEMHGFAGVDLTDPADPARRAADAALDMVAGADAVIFDLRNNGGGAPAMVGYLVSAFTPADAPIYNVFHSRTSTHPEKPDRFRANPRLDVPVYVLISGRTGSAGESFPYTLQAAKRAVVVGEPSGGAANPGGVVRIPGGFSVFVSGGSPINPITKRNWEGEGVQPDIAVPAADALRTAQARALEAIVAKHADRHDARWALEALKAMGSPVAVSDLSSYAGSYGPLAVTAAGSVLELKRGRRPSLSLVPLGGDAFFVAGDPMIRFVFERDAQGAIVALEQRDPFGASQRQRRAT